MATRCTECTWAFCKDVQTSSLVLSPGFHIKSSPPRLCARILLLVPLVHCVVTSFLPCSAPLRENSAGSGLEQFDRGEVSPEIAAILCGERVGLCGGMSRDQEVGEDGGSGTTLIAIGAEDLSGKK